MTLSRHRIRAGHKRASAEDQYRSPIPQSVWASSQRGKDITPMRKSTIMTDEPGPASRGAHHYVWKCEHVHHYPPQPPAQMRVQISYGARQVSVSGIIPFQ